MVARTAAALLALWLGAADAALEVENADGERATLSLGEGEHALVVHFWASWCPECGEELPGLERAVRECGGEVRVVAVNVGEPADVARRFLERHGSALPLFRDPDGRVWRRLARGLPANLIWTRAGRRVEVGPKDPSKWGSLLSRLGCRSMTIPKRDGSAPGRSWVSVSSSRLFFERGAQCRDRSMPMPPHGGSQATCERWCATSTR